MVKTPKTRHSRSRRDPVTIELEPGAVSRIEEPAAEQAAEASQPAAEDATAQEAMRAPQADFEPWEHDEAAQAAAGHEGGSAGAPRDEDEGAEPVPSQPAPQKRGGLGLLGAGLIGGLVALAGGGALQYAGLLGVPGGAANDVGSRIADLTAQITAVKNAGDGGLGMKVDNLSGALDEVKADVAALQNAGPSDGDDAALSALTGKVAALEKAVAAAAQSGASAPADLGPLNEKLAALDALVKSAGEASTAQEGRLSALEQSVSQLSAKVEAQASQPKVALAIAASALKAALDRGGPFTAELDTFAAIAPDAPEIAALRAYADKGVPTRVEIAGGMDEAANAMVAAAEPADADAGVFQRLLSSAESLVKVRPIGAVAGKGVPETVARMEVAVEQGDYAAALAEYDTLPEPVKTAGADFAGKLKARLDVEAKADALISGAMKG